MDTSTRPSLEELRRAYRAAARGDFSDDPANPGAGAVGPHAGSVGRWETAEPVVAVLGCHGGAGASVVALAIATAHTGRARVVECGAATTSAFCAASTAELGQTETGWVAGERGNVRLERGSGLPAHPDELPAPDQPQAGLTLTVLDVTWDPRVLHGSSGWLAHTAFSSCAPVLVTTATAPGMRHLEAVLHLLAGGTDPVVVVRGAHRRGRWPAPVHRQTGARTRALRQAGRVLAFPTDNHLTVNGLDPNPLPASVTTAGAHVLRLTHNTTTTAKATGTDIQEMNR